MRPMTMTTRRRDRKPPPPVHALTALRTLTMYSPPPIVKISIIARDPYWMPWFDSDVLKDSAADIWGERLLRRVLSKKTAR